MATFFMIVGIISTIMICFMLIILFIAGGENGYEHTCAKANKCPASIRCSNEKEMSCYEGIHKRG